MKRHALIVVAALSFGFGPQDDELNWGYAMSPASFRDGSATLEQIKAWIAGNNSYLPVAPKWEVVEKDLDFDGRADLLISDGRLGGSGGSVYSVFLRTPQGFRYIAVILGWIRGIPVERGQPSRFVTGHSLRSGQALVQLAELRTDGLHRVAKASVAAGDSGTSEGNRLYRELMESATISPETLRRVFGASGG